jgi:cytochrome c biogenesis protein CcdA
MTNRTRFRRLVRSPLALVGAVAAFGAIALLSACSSQTAVTSSPDASAVDPSIVDAIEPSLDIVLFWHEGCPRCADEREWLQAVEIDYPDLAIHQYQVDKDHPANKDLFTAYGERYDFPATNVPVTVIGERVWIGWTSSIEKDITEAVDSAARGEFPQAGLYGSVDEGTCSQDDPYCVVGEVYVDVPFFGQVSLGEKSLLASTLIIGFVDGINPCSLWVISVLLTIVIRTASRRRVIAIGATFLTVTAGMYALYMASIFSALTFVDFIGAIQITVAIVAAVFAFVSIKDYFAFKKGLSFTISDSKKPGIYKRIRDAAGHHSLIPALAATVALGVAVSLIETPCTAGFPIIWMGLLKSADVGFLGTALLFVAYMIPFLLDEMIVFGIAVVTMKATKMQEKHGEILKLVAGVTMLALAAALVFAPSLMEDPMTALALFIAAFALAAAVHLITMAVRKNLELARAEE